jgi:hypothetical protein
MTSGSTGRRTTSYFDEPVWVLAKNLVELRARQVCGVRPRGPDRPVPGGRAGPADDPAGRRPARLTIHRPIKEMLPALRAFAPTCSMASPVTSRGWRALGDGLRPRLVFPLGQPFDPATGRIETGLGTPVFDVALSDGTLVAPSSLNLRGLSDRGDAAILVRTNPGGNRGVARGAEP